jgi:hypothetical protein
MDAIPKRCFTFWQGHNFSKLHYYTIYSLVKYNPNLEITVYTSTSVNEQVVTWTTDEHSIDITNRVPFSSIHNFGESVKIVDVDLQTEYGISNEISVVHKADFIRIAKLYEHGGIWFDFDILFIRPIPNTIFEKTTTELFYFKMVFNGNLLGIPTGFIAARSKLSVVKKLLDRAMCEVMNPDSYQKIGPDLWTSVFIEHKDSLMNAEILDHNIVYPYDHHEVEDLLSNGGLDRVTPNTIGIHWFNGSVHTKKFINRDRRTILYPSRCPLNKYIRMVETNPFP